MTEEERERERWGLEESMCNVCEVKRETERETDRQRERERER